MVRIDDDELAARLRSSISKHARRARCAKNLTQRQVAERMSNSADHYGRIERGEALPSVEVLLSLAIALDISIDSLLDSSNLQDASGAPSPPEELADIIEQLRDDPELCALVESLIKATEGK